MSISLSLGLVAETLQVACDKQGREPVASAVMKKFHWCVCPVAVVMF